MNGQNRSSVSHWHRHGLPFALALISVASQIAGDDLINVLRFDRGALLEGDVWRLLTGNVVHLGWNHLLLNLAGLALIWWLTDAALSLKRWLIVFTATSLGVTIGLLLWNPELRWYVGLSGMLHGVLLAGLLADMEDADCVQWLLLAGVVAKLVWEQVLGPSASTEALVGGHVVVDSHLYGAISGAMLGVLFWAWDRRRFGIRRAPP